LAATWPRCRWTLILTVSSAEAPRVSAAHAHWIICPTCDGLDILHNS